MSLFKYDLRELPDDLMDLLIHDTFLDIVVILLCSIIYIGGSVAVVYAAILFKVPILQMISVWTICMVANNLFCTVPKKLYGLSYLDNGNELAVGITMLMGPFGALRLISLFLFFIARVGPLRLLRVRVHEWDYPGYWAQIFKLKAEQYRERNIELRRKIMDGDDSQRSERFNKVRAILRKRIEII